LWWRFENHIFDNPLVNVHPNIHVNANANANVAAKDKQTTSKQQQANNTTLLRVHGSFSLPRVFRTRFLPNLRSSGCTAEPTTPRIGNSTIPTSTTRTRTYHPIRDETKHPSGGPDATAVSSGTNRIESNPEHTPKQSGINSRGRITKPTASTCSTGSRRVELSEPQRDPRARHARIVVVDRWCLLLPTFQWEPIPVFGTRRETRRRRARSKHCRLCHGR